MNLVDKCSQLYFLKFTRQYKANKPLYYFLIISILTAIFLTFYISLLILFLLYIGILLERNKTFSKLLKYIEKKDLLLRIILRSILAIFFITLIILIFPIIPLLIIYFGMKFEKRSNKWIQKEKPILNIFSNYKEKNERNPLNSAKLPIKRGN